MVALTTILVVILAACSRPAERLVLGATEQSAIVPVAHTRGGGPRCSAVLTDSGTLMTAAHCLIYDGLEVRVRGQTEEIHNLNVQIEPSRDLATVVLDIPVDVHSSFVGLPLARRPPGVGESAVAWGYGGGRPLHPHHVIVRRVEAERVFVETVDRVGMCPGDSGGPLLVREDDRLVVAGVLWSSRRDRSLDIFTRVGNGFGAE